MAGSNTKLGEMLYVKKQDAGGYRWLIKKPFSLDKFSPRYFIDFGLILSHLELPPGSKVLDVGCGSGWHSDWLAQCGYKVLGLDISLDMLRCAKERVGTIYSTEWGRGIEFQGLCGDAEAMPIKPGSMDGVLFYDMLHHIPQWERALSEAVSVLRDGGRMVIIDPSSNHYDVATMERYGVLERGLHPSVVRRKLKALGMSKVVVKIEPLWLKSEIGTDFVPITESVYANELISHIKDLITIPARLRRRYLIVATK